MGRMRIRGLIVGLALLAPLPAGAIDGSLPPPLTSAVEIPDAQVEAAIARLDALAQEVLEKTGVPGLAVAVVWRGEQVYAKGFGVRDLEQPQPVEADTVFQIASLSKALAASVVASQVGAGLVAWDSKVAELLPGFALSDPWVTAQVTIADLFSHRSGLPEHAGDDLEDMGYDRAAVLARLRYLPLLPFRLQDAYTNFGLTAAAEAVAETAGTDWASLSEQSLYGPLGMTLTSSRHADFLARENRTVGHLWDGERFVKGPQRQPDAQSPAGGVSSTVEDLARWMIMVLGEGKVGETQMIPAKALLPAITPKIISRQPGSAAARAGSYGYGFGVSVEPSGRVMISHSGAFYLGTGTNFMLLPSEDLGIVVLSNGSPIGAVEALTAEFMDLVQFGTITRDWISGYRSLIAPLLAPVGSLVGQEPPSDPRPAAPLASYSGSYHSDYFGTARVVQDGNGLTLELGPDPETFSLRHWTGDIFAYAPLYENAPVGSLGEVVFSLNVTGRAAGFTIDILNKEGQGQFTRVATED